MLNSGSASQPISASNCNRLHSASTTTILQSPRLSQGLYCWAISVVWQGLAFQPSKSLSMTQCSPLDTWRTGSWLSTFVFWHDFWGTISSSCTINFSAQFVIFWIGFSFTVLIFNHDELFFRRLVCSVFKSILSIHTTSWSSLYFVIEVSIFFLRISR